MGTIAKKVCFTNYLLHVMTDFMRAAHFDQEIERWLAEVMSYWADSWFLILFFGRHFQRICCIFVLQFFQFETVFPHRPYPAFLAHIETELTLYYLNPLYFLKVKNRSGLMRKTKGSPAVPKFALRNYSFVVVAENQRCLLTCLLLPPINFTGFLAAVPGSSEDNADLGKTAFFCCLLIELAGLQKPQLIEYHKD